MEMKPILALLAALFMGSLTRAQTTVDLSMHFEPNTVYRIYRMEKLFEETIYDSVGDTRTYQSWPRGRPFKVTGNLQTGDRDTATGRLTVKLSLNRQTVKDTALTTPITVFGTAATDSLPVFDSVADDIDDFGALLRWVNDIFLPMRLPNARIGINDSLTSTLPFGAQINERGMLENLEMVYTLKSLDSGIARFALQVKMTAPGAAESQVVILGLGTGELEFDTRLHVISRQHWSYLKLTPVANRQGWAIKRRVDVVETVAPQR